MARSTALGMDREDLQSAGAAGGKVLDLRQQALRAPRRPVNRWGTAIQAGGMDVPQVAVDSLAHHVGVVLPQGLTAGSARVHVPKTTTRRSLTLNTSWLEHS
jgi:hypothetical protein